MNVEYYRDVAETVPVWWKGEWGASFTEVQVPKCCSFPHVEPHGFGWLQSRTMAMAGPFRKGCISDSCGGTPDSQWRLQLLGRKKVGNIVFDVWQQPWQKHQTAASFCLPGQWWKPLLGGGNCRNMLIWSEAGGCISRMSGMRWVGCQQVMQHHSSCPIEVAYCPTGCLLTKRPIYFLPAWAALMKAGNCFPGR